MYRISSIFCSDSRSLMTTWFNIICLRKKFVDDCFDKYEIKLVSLVDNIEKLISMKELHDLLEQDKIYGSVLYEDWYFCCYYTEKEYNISTLIDGIESVEPADALWRDMFKRGLNLNLSTELAYSMDLSIKSFWRTLGLFQSMGSLSRESKHYHFFRPVVANDIYVRNLGSVLLNHKDTLYFDGSNNRFLMFRFGYDLDKVAVWYSYNPKLNLELL